MDMEEMLKILACPKCHGNLEAAQGNAGFVCRHCALVYPVANGIPVMLVEDAVPLSDWQAGQKAGD